MYSIEGRLVYSVTDLSGFLACPHLTLLSRRAACGGPKPPVFPDPALEALRMRGDLHERAWLEALRNRGTAVELIPQDYSELPHDERWQLAAQATVAAMQRGASAIYQGTLYDGTWIGKPDFLLRIPRPSALGEWSYEVADAKLAREAKGGALLQVLLYSSLLAEVTGAMPERAHLALGGPEPRTEAFRISDYAAFFRSIRTRFIKHIESAPSKLPLAVEPAEHCGICAWSTVCEGERRAVDHLSFVAGISRAQRRALAANGVLTLEALATLGAANNTDIGKDAFARIHGQARVQLQGRRDARPVHELLRPVVPGEGLAALPEPSDGDLFFDLEGDPFALQSGIEYLFGRADMNGDYDCVWALDRNAEKRAFEDFMDFVRERREKYPNMHVYHFGHYEPTALKKLMGRFATREVEMDRLLRAGVFVDLHRVVRQGLRASVESYSIKRLERFYRFTRAVDLRAAGDALAHFESWLELGGEQEEGDALRGRIQGYNRDDCLSTLELRNWLEFLRADLARESGAQAPRPLPPDSARSDEAEERNAEIAALLHALTGDVPVEVSERNAEQQARWLLAQLLEYHRREDKAMWWEYFRCMALSQEELVEDRATMGGLEYVGVVGEVKRSRVHRYRFPSQEYTMRPGQTVVDPATQKPPGQLVAIDDADCTLDLKRGTNSRPPHPRALILKEDVDEKPLRDSLARIARAVVEHGMGDANPFPCAMQLLQSRAPRFATHSDGLPGSRGDSSVDRAVKFATALDRTILAVQGPPGSGKTYTAARMIVRALQTGMRVGVSALSHKAIGNLLECICSLAAEEGLAIKGMQKADEAQRCAAPEIVTASRNEDIRDALSSGATKLAAGTAWLWSREDMIGSVDVLFVDEAGQFPLANAMAIAPAAGSVVLLGDPRQLEQPQQGLHPPGADVSALDHLLAGEKTMPPERGLFLEHTWRMHPDICAFTSEIFYEGRLQSKPGLERQCVIGPRPLSGSGLRFVGVDHRGNSSESSEEVEVVASLVQRALASSWTNENGEVQPILIGDILVVTPFNLQMLALARALPPGARIGTVDRFQGQEAAVVICSMAASSAVDAPRGVEFLYSPNRLNVATSRARCLAILVASPALFTPDCKSTRQMRLANPFCRLAELASQSEHRTNDEREHRVR